MNRDIKTIKCTSCKEELPPTWYSDPRDKVCIKCKRKKKGGKV